MLSTKCLYASAVLRFSQVNVVATEVLTSAMANRHTVSTTFWKWFLPRTLALSCSVTPSMLNWISSIQVFSLRIFSSVHSNPLERTVTFSPSWWAKVTISSNPSYIVGSPPVKVTNSPSAWEKSLKTSFHFSTLNSCSNLIPAFMKQWTQCKLQALVR